MLTSTDFLRPRVTNNEINDDWNEELFRTLGIDLTLKVGLDALLLLGGNIS